MQDWSYPAVAGLIVLAVLLVLQRRRARRPKDYRYVRTAFLTAAETEFYKVLLSLAGDNYRVFAQVPLTALLDTDDGQDQRAARSRIDRKTVDFVLCDPESLRPLLAIELDDKSHHRPDRMARDRMVDRIFGKVGPPLLRIANRGRIRSADVAQQLKLHLS